MKRFSDLTEDLVEEILARLPASSLVRFKSVCKWWKSLISDHRFIHNHLQLRITNAAAPAPSEISLLLGWTRRLRDISPIYQHVDFDDDDRELDKRQALSLVTIDNDKADAATTEDNDPLPFSTQEVFMPLQSRLLRTGEGALKALAPFHCNGIICLVDISPLFCKRVVFYNPALRQGKFLITTRFGGFGSRVFGFGYDSKTGRFKFVRILVPVDLSSVSKAEVYTLGTSSCKVFKLDRYCDPYYGHGTYHNGVYYWLFYGNGGERILSFDMSEEKFSSFTVPDIVRDRQRWTDLLVQGESLVYFNSPGEGVFETWVMENNDDDAKDVEWTKYTTIAPSAGIIRPLIFWKNNELLMEAEDGRIVSFHLRTGKLKTLSFGAFVRCSIDATFYVESLVSVLSKNIS